MGSSANSGLDYLTISDRDREVVNEVLTRAIKLRQNQFDYLAQQTALATWGGKSTTS